MHNTVKDIVSLNQKLEKEIPNVLNDTISELKRLVDDEAIISFSFLQNDIYLANEKPVYVNVSTNQHSDVRLGLLENLTEVEKALRIKLPKDLKKIFDNINANLYMLNEHFPKKMPRIRRRTYYSINAVNKEGGFAKEDFLLLPEFEWQDSAKTLKMK